MLDLCGRFAACLALVAAAHAPLAAQTAQPATPRMTSRRVADTDRATILRLTLPAGYRDPITAGTSDLIVVQGSAGNIEVVLGKETQSSRQEPGKVWYVPKTTPHGFSNVGSDAFDLIVIVLKP